MSATFNYNYYNPFLFIINYFSLHFYHHLTALTIFLTSRVHTLSKLISFRHSSKLVHPAQRFVDPSVVHLHSCFLP